MVLEDDDDRPLLIFGGPYSNLPATEAIIAKARELGIGPERVICTGDVIAYCAEPEETARALASWGCHVIQGNCEQQIAAGGADCGCNFESGSACDLLSKGWYPFATARTSAEMQAWMSTLPTSLTFRFGGLSFRVVHGGVAEVSKWVFASQAHTIKDECEASGADVTIAGHCGLPFIAKSEDRFWFNAGVIGMPANDGTTDVWYGLVEKHDVAVRLSTHRLNFDFRREAASMRRFGHANGYARTLVTGVWPSHDVLPAFEREATGIPIDEAEAIIGRSGTHNLTPGRSPSN